MQHSEQTTQADQWTTLATCLIPSLLQHNNYLLFYFSGSHELQAIMFDRLLTLYLQSMGPHCEQILKFSIQRLQNSCPVFNVFFQILISTFLPRDAL